MKAQHSSAQKARYHPETPPAPSPGSLSFQGNVCPDLFFSLYTDMHLDSRAALNGPEIMSSGSLVSLGGWDSSNELWGRVI